MTRGANPSGPAPTSAARPAAAGYPLPPPGAALVRARLVAASLALLPLLAPAAGRAAAPSPPPAAEPDPLAGGTAGDWRELYLRARALSEAAGDPILLMPVGEVARAATRKAAGLMAPGQAHLRPLPTVGERQAEVALALGSEGQRCGAVVEAQGATLGFLPVGDCRPAARPDPAGPSGPPLLSIGTRRGDPSWLVRDEGGQVVDAWRYAALTHDEDLRERLLVERGRHRVGRALLTAAGVGLVAGAVVPLAASAVAAPEVAEDRRFTALFLGVTGATLVVGARLDRLGLEARQGQVGRYLRADDAADVVADHNARVLRRRAPPPPPQAPPPQEPPPQEPPPQEPPPQDPPPAPASEPGP
ncbi:hypothetical protein L6R53_22825 [Myxococcota bacterium]|nr:hypothetical protein [Myxococcota bacterium]